MGEMSLPYDPSKKRPLEICVRDLSDEGGISDQDLMIQSQNRVAADALFLIRILFNEGDHYAMSVMSLVGQTREPMAVQALFDMWVRMAGYIVNEAKTDENSIEDLSKRRFCLKTLNELQLNSKLQRLEKEVLLVPPTPPEWLESPDSDR